MMVLIVDDDDLTVELMCTTLQAFGHSTRSATNVADALALIAGDTPHLVLSDLRFSGSTGAASGGRELAESVRSKPAYADIRMVAISGATEPAEVRAALDCGFDEVIAKPFDIAALLARIDGFGLELRCRQRPT